MRLKCGSYILPGVEGQQWLLGVLISLCCWGLGVYSPAMAQSTTVQMQVQQLDSSETIAFDQFWHRLAEADIVYLGEVHDNPVDHAAELSILDALSHRAPQLGVGLEMFQRPFQPALDDYLSAAIDGNQLRQRSEYERRWGFPWQYYRPILELARHRHLPLIALNAPQEVTNQVSLGGLESLTAAEKQLIPPIDRLDLDNPRYQQLLRQVYDSIHPTSATNFFEAFKTVQLIWDATMADSIIRYHHDHPQQLLLVLVGQGHVIYNFGIPSRVQAALPGVRQCTVLLSQGAWPDVPGAGAIADFQLVQKPPVEPAKAKL